MQSKKLIIDVENAALRITDTSNLLKSNNVLQLSSWGFQHYKTRQSYEIQSVELNKILPKVIDHLNKKQIPFELTDSSELLLSAFYDRKKVFEKIKDRATNFKDGNFVSSDFKNYVNLLAKNVVRKLKEHQIKASYHHYILGNNANFSVPGSGKTTTVLANYHLLKREGKVNVLFVIGPPACFGPWKKEFKETLGYSAKVKTLSGDSKSKRKFAYLLSEAKDTELFLISYHAACNDRIEIGEFFKRDDIQPMLVVDEAHYLKQIGGNWAEAILSFAQHAKFKCALTGTPMPKSYTDLFNLFEFLWPGQNIFDNESKILIHNYEKEKNIDSAKAILRDRISPLFYRVRKKELGLREPNFLPPIIIPMKKYEKLIYDAILTRIRHYSKEDYLQNINIVDKLRRGRIIRLRQCISYVPLLLTAVEGYEEHLLEGGSEILNVIKGYDRLERPGKCDHLINLIGSLKKKKQKVVIWANFVKTLKMLRIEIKKEGIECDLIYGSTPIAPSCDDSDVVTREEIINKFLDKDSGLDVLIANPAACAESISLHKSCHNAIYYDLSYNCRGRL